MTSPSTSQRDPFGLFANAEEMITGTVVCAAAIAYSAGHVASVARLMVVILGTVAVYWLAHLHAVTIESALTLQHHPGAALRHALAETWTIAGASVAPLAVLLVTTAIGASLRTAAWTALIVTVGLLTAYSYVAGARGGLDTWGRIASAVAGAGLGIVVVLLKVALH